MLSRRLGQQAHHVQTSSTSTRANALAPTRGLPRTVVGPAGPSTCPSRATPSGRRHVARAKSSRGNSGGSGGTGGTDDDADWEAEMSIFKERISRPNQLATLRELEAKVSLGKVLYARDGLAIVSGLNPDAPLGTKVAFLTGAAGVLLWHRSDNLSFCLVLGDPSSLEEGTPVECKIKGVLQVVDDVKGPITRKDYELFMVPAGEDAFGRVASHTGAPRADYPTAAAAGAAGAGQQAGSGSGAGKTRPLINQQVEMKNREQISESLLTGVKGLDILTPLGRGASLLVIGPGGSGKTRLGLDAVLAQAAAPSSPGGVPPGGPVRCVLALVGRPAAECQAIVSELRDRGALSNTAVVVCEEGQPLGHQYAAMCCACSIGERVRDEGGHCLVVVDDIRPLSDVWEQLLAGLAGLGPALLREGLVKDERGRDMPVVPPPGAGAGTAAGTGAAPDAAAAAAGSGPGVSIASAGSVDGLTGSAGAGAGAASAGVGSEDDDSALVEYEGMLVSGAVAQRRGFLSTFFMRAAKMSRANGGGSLSLLPLVPGTCATGVSKRIDMSKYKTLSPEQIAKLEAALRAKQLAEELANGPGPGELSTEVVEEFISIADGQVVLQQQQAGAANTQGQQAGCYVVNPKLSITRIGTRAYYKALEGMAPQVRLDLAQADDARRFSTTSTSSTSSTSSLDGTAGGTAAGNHEARMDALTRRLGAALVQQPGRPASLAEQVVTLFAVQRGFLDAVPPEQVGDWLRGALAHVAAEAPKAMEDIGRTAIFTAESETRVTGALRSFLWRP